MEGCFLCGSKSIYQAFHLVEETNAPHSNRPLQMVLKHLANLIKVELIFRGITKLCINCFQELSDYDELMVKLLAFQTKLKNKVQLCTIKNEKNIEVENHCDYIVEEQIIEENIAEDQIIENVGFDDEIITFDDQSDGFSYTDSNSDIPVNPRKRAAQDCIICSASFSTKFLLQEHMRSNHDEKVHSCNICGAVRRDEEYLELHMNIHEGKTENECRYCPKRFARPINTLRHMRKHWDRKKYQCEKCGERFSLDNMLYNHRLRHEAEENPLICSICNQSFKSRKTFNHHILIHQENRPRHHCTLCNKSFTERYTLKVHMKSHDMNSSPLLVAPELVEETDNTICTLVIDDNCIVCNTKFETKEEYEKHLQEAHDVILK